jgi:hypothetical protein
MVHWIDSKASFGDDRTHTQQMEGQYATYVNRYGPGCVIYWFGYISDLSVSVQVQNGEVEQQGPGGAEGMRPVDVLLRNTFPAAEEIMQLHQHSDPTAAAAAAAAAHVGAGPGASCLVAS